jgi:hypothetical protein
MKELQDTRIELLITRSYRGHAPRVRPRWGIGRGGRGELSAGLTVCRDEGRMPESKSTPTVRPPCGGSGRAAAPVFVRTAALRKRAGREGAQLDPFIGVFAQEPEALTPRPADRRWRGHWLPGRASPGPRWASAGLARIGG